MFGYFEVTGSEFEEAMANYKRMLNQQAEFVRGFTARNGIEAELYSLSGSGRCNTPFDEKDKSRIRFGIVPTKNDVDKFGKYLRVPGEYDLRYFVINCKLNKEFAQECVDKKIPVNILAPRIRDYLSGLNGHDVRITQSRFFIHDGRSYLEANIDGVPKEHFEEGSTYFGKNIQPIKGSAYHMVKEIVETKEKAKGEQAE